MMFHFISITYITIPLETNPTFQPLSHEDGLIGQVPFAFPGRDSAFSP